MTHKHLFCFGLGYTAAVLARTLKDDGWSVTGTARQADGVARLQEEGFQALQFDGTAPAAAMAGQLADVTHLLLSIPPGEEGDLVLHHHQSDISAAPNLRWVGYLSTTGVYGDHGGAWVDEDTPTQPSLPRTARRVAAEQDWLAWGRTQQVTVQIFRLAGIYGPGRNTLVSLLSGKARRLDKPGQVFSRIHVHDISEVLQRAAVAAGDTPAGKSGIFNICDDCPEAPHVVVGYGAELLKMAPPPLVPFDSADLTPMARSFYQDNRRVSNRRMKAVFDYELQYPDYQAGLKALLPSLNPASTDAG